MSTSARSPVPSPPPLLPSEEEWAALSPAAREEIVERVAAHWDSVLEEEFFANPEGDHHLDAWVEARQTLKRFFGRGPERGLYIGANMTILYPQTRGFSPDLFAVRDVPRHRRKRWVVSAEGRGIDLALEVCHSGDRGKDFEANVVFYAQLGICEYFAVDILQGRVRAWRLPSKEARAYQPILAQGGRYASEVLGLELALEGEGLRFFLGNAELLGPTEQLGRLEQRLDEAQGRAEEAQGRAEEAQGRAEEAQGRANEAIRALREAIQTLLAVRGVTLAAAELARIEGCDDVALLRRWLGRAATAATGELLLDA